jgi:hypothetical protein
MKKKIYIFGGGEDLLAKQCTEGGLLVRKKYTVRGYVPLKTDAGFHLF